MVYAPQLKRDVLASETGEETLRHCNQLGPHAAASTIIPHIKLINLGH